MNFETFNFHPDVMAGVRKLGYSVPKPIQLQAIPPIMEGRDVIGLAKGGTDKTLAFVLPILQHLNSGPRGYIRALIISPTHELADQTCEAFNHLGSRTDLRCVALYGQVGMKQQRKALNSGAEIVVACPDRLINFLWRGMVSLSDLEIFVIDEADEMLDMGFLPHIYNILDCILNKRQTLLFSATMPENIKRLSHKILDNPVTVQSGLQLPPETITQTVLPVQQSLKTGLLREILKNIETDSVLVFTRTKLRAIHAALKLTRAGYRVTALQGNLRRQQLQTALDGLGNGSVKILVVTDTASRGIDVARISRAINKDVPENSDNYIHNVGRAGRMDKNSDAYTFVTSADAAKIRVLEQTLETPIERMTLESFDYSKPATDDKQRHTEKKQPDDREIEYF